MEQVIKKLLDGQYIARDRTHANFYTFWDTDLEVSYFQSSFFTLSDIDIIVKHNDKWYLFNSYLISECNVSMLVDDAIKNDIETVLANSSKKSWVECKDINLLQYRKRLTFDEL